MEFAQLIDRAHWTHGGSVQRLLGGVGATLATGVGWAGSALSTDSCRFTPQRQSRKCSNCLGALEIQRLIGRSLPPLAWCLERSLLIDAM